MDLLALTNSCGNFGLYCIMSSQVHFIQKSAIEKKENKLISVLLQGKISVLLHNTISVLRQTKISVLLHTKTSVLRQTKISVLLQTKFSVLLHNKISVLLHTEENGRSKAINVFHRHHSCHQADKTGGKSFFDCIGQTLMLKSQIILMATL